MNSKKYMIVYNTKPSHLVYLKCNTDSVNIEIVSPYSNKSEQQRLEELDKSVMAAKLALSTFSYNQSQSHNFFYRLKSLFTVKAH